MNISDLFNKYIIYILALVILIVFIAIIKHIINLKRKHRVTNHTPNFEEKNYQDNIIQALPYNDQLDYSNLYNKLKSINNTIDHYNNTIKNQKTDAIDSIKSKVIDSQLYIDNYWKTQKQKKDFYHCIGLHFASFTLANSIKREQENIRDAFVKTKVECDRLSNEIERLNILIEKAHGPYRYNLMQQHKELCSQHKNLCELKGIFASRNTQYLNMVKAQNIKTKNYRNYIINHFGRKGRQWGEKLKKEN